MGAPTYKGLIAWTDESEGETSDNMRATSNRDPAKLVKELFAYINDDDIIVALEIKRVNSD